MKVFPSHTAAREDGYNNVSMVVIDKYNRQLFGGLRWFKKEDFDPKNMPKMKVRNQGKPFKCIETGEVFISSVEAAEAKSNDGYQTSASQITSVCKGNRMMAGGFKWKYAEISIE